MKSSSHTASSDQQGHKLLHCGRSLTSSVSAVPKEGLAAQGVHAAALFNDKYIEGKKMFAGSHMPYAQ